MQLNELKTILPYAASIYKVRINLFTQLKGETLQRKIHEIAHSSGTLLTTAAAEKEATIGYGGAWTSKDRPQDTFIRQWGTQGRLNLYTTKLAAAAEELERHIDALGRQTGPIALLSINLAMLLAIQRPAYQSGQRDICRLYRAKRKIEERERRVIGI